MDTNAFGKLLRDCRESHSRRLVINAKKPSPALVGDLRLLLVTASHVTQLAAFLLLAEPAYRWFTAQRCRCQLDHRSAFNNGQCRDTGVLARPL